MEKQHGKHINKLQSDHDGEFPFGRIHNVLHLNILLQENNNKMEY